MNETTLPSCQDAPVGPQFAHAGLGSDEGYVFAYVQDGQATFDVPDGAVSYGLVGVNASAVIGHQEGSKLIFSGNLPPCSQLVLHYSTVENRIGSASKGF
jgi:hypothetical protein